MKFRKKPVIIEAIQWTGDNLEEVLEFVSNSIGLTEEEGTPNVFIHTLEGVMHASVGDWIIRGIRGEFYPCKPDIFKETYELIN